MATLVQRREAEVTRMPRRFVITEWVVGIAGVLAAGVGAWMYYVPADWFLGGLAETWYFGLFIAAGLLLATAFGLFARAMLREDRVWTTRVVLAAAFAVIAAAAAVTFGIILIL